MGEHAAFRFQVVEMCQKALIDFYRVQSETEKNRKWSSSHFNLLIPFIDTGAGLEKEKQVIW